MIFVTGSAGFIGSHLVKALNDLGGGVLTVDPKLSSPELQSVDALIENCGQYIKAVFHMGAISDTTCDDYEALIETNLRLSQRLAHFCQQKKIPFIYASSAAVYGNGEGPLNKYAEVKLLFDDWMSDKMDFPWYGCRFFNVYGPGEAHKGRQASMVHQMYEAMADGERPRLFALDAKRDFIHVDDVVEIMLWMWRTRPAYGIYDVGTAVPASFGQVFDIMENALGISHGYEEIEMPENLVGKYQFNTQADLMKLAKEGYQPAPMMLYRGIRKFIAQADRSRRPSRPLPAPPPATGS